MFDRNKPEQVAEADRLSSFMVHKALEMEGTCTGEHGVGTGKIKYLPGELQLLLLSLSLLLLIPLLLVVVCCRWQKWSIFGPKSHRY